VDAVRCAVEIQEELRVINAELPENRRMHFRIGINLGDVVEEEERIYGDGINIAARVEGLAEGGGICISGTVYDSIKNKLSLSYEPLGEHTVKNITEPVRVYRMRVGPEVAVQPKPRQWHKPALAALVVLIVAVGAWAIWNFYFRPPPMEPASEEKMAFPLPDKPSIAVLPFDNLTGDPQQEYFSDGMTEEIITSLSKVPYLFVIARNSTFSYKGKPVKIRQVAEELGVRYVLEGSVRRAGDRVRVTAQLIDAIKGHHLWAERYDRDLKDIFAVQDEITKEIIAALNVELTIGEQARIAAKGTDNLEAYLKFMQAKEYTNRHTIESNASAQQLAQEAIELDPKYASAYRILGLTHMHDILLGRSKSPKESLGKAIALVKKSIELDDLNGYNHAALGFLLVMIRQYDKAVAEGERGVALDPNVADGYGWLGMIYRYVGRWEDAITAYEKGIRLNPIPPIFYLYGLGLAYGWTGRYEEGITELKKAIQIQPDSPYNRMMAAAVYSLAGRDEEARKEGAELLKLNPKFSLKKWGKSLKYKNQNDQERLISALRKAGLPE
jgi:adenylate cyclase